MFAVRESWTGDLKTADTEDLKTMSPSQIRVKRFISKDVDNSNKNKEICIHMQHARNLARMTATIHCCLPSGDDLRQEKKKHLQKKKKKPEIQVQILQLDKISVVL